jgi:outer membrane lipoprotein-sorting protein
MALLSVPAVSRGEEPKVPSPDSPEFPRYVMNKVDDQYRGTKSHGVMEMTVQTKHWKRSISMESWSLGEEYSLMRILKPKKERGTATLKAKNDLYTYLSKTDRSIKITANMMGGSWMGSHFTNDDLVRHTRLSDDFHIKLVFKGQEKGQAVYRFSLKPKTDVPVVWGKIEVAVRQSDLQPLSQLFFDEKGKKMRILEFSKHQVQGDRVMPMKMVMKPLDGSGEYTLVEWKEIDFGVKLSKSFFTIQKLKSF